MADIENIKEFDQSLKEKEYWKMKLSGEIDKVSFPFDKNIDTTNYKLEDLKFTIQDELYHSLMKISNGSDYILHMVFVAGLITLLQKYNNKNIILVGIPIEKQESEVDLINKNLVIKGNISGDLTFKDLLKEVRQNILEAVNNQNYPLSAIVHDLNIKIDEHGFPLCDVGVVMDGIHGSDYISELRLNTIFLFKKSEENIDCTLRYNSELYFKNTIQNLSEKFTKLLLTLINNLDRGISQIDILSSAEREFLLFDFNNTNFDIGDNMTVCKLFENQVRKQPDSIAIKIGNTSYTYDNLNRRANQFSHYLIEKNVKEGSIVGILLNRSFEFIVSILAVLKSGAAYLPISPETKESILNFMVSDSKIKLLLTERNINMSSSFQEEVIYVDDYQQFDNMKSNNIDFPISNSQPAYVIYTSGSSGKPKGTVILHNGLSNYAIWASKNYDKGEKIDFPLFTSVSFDLTITSIFVPLISGGSIHIYRQEENEVILEKILNENKVQAIKLTPSHLKLIKNKKFQNSNLKRIIVGGEQLSTNLARDIFNNFYGKVEIINEYGPTEATVGCMIHRYTKDEVYRNAVAIGVPANNTRIYILDKNLSIVPMGAEGEIYIAGKCLAKGYLFNKELTEQKFIDDPFFPGEKMYASGDIAKFLHTKKIEFCGRKDLQVKIRGYRVELDEVEYWINKALEKNNISVENIIIIDKKDNNDNKYLCAYIQSNTNIDLNSIREFLLINSPTYMIPSYITQINNIPLTINGKLDIEKLPDPTSNLSTGKEYFAPRDDKERKIALIWSKVLGVKKVGIDDSYFALGGDSIRAIQLLAELQKIGLNLELNQLFQYPTIRELTSFTQIKENDISQEDVDGIIPLTPIQKWFFEKKLSNKQYYNQAILLFSEMHLEKELIVRAFDKILQHHDILRVCFKFDGDSVTQYSRKPNEVNKDFFVFNLDNNSSIDEIIYQKCTEIHSSINLEDGPLLKLCLFKTYKGDYLSIIIHQSIIDSESWRILLEDFFILYKQILENSPLELPLKTLSYKSWSEGINKIADEGLALKELEFWSKMSEGGRTANAELFNITQTEIKYSDIQKLSLSISKEITLTMLNDIQKVYNTEIEHILLSACCIAFNKWKKLNTIFIDFVGNGREGMNNINRTLGWFTSVYPILLSCNYDKIADTIKSTKEHIRKIPNRGIGYGILKYLTLPKRKESHILNNEPKILFNYLGQINNIANNGEFIFSTLQSGANIGLENETNYQIEIICSVIEGKLNVDIKYNGNVFDIEEISSLSRLLEASTHEIINHCLERNSVEYTLSDYSGSDLNESEIGDIMSEIDEIL